MALIETFCKGKGCTARVHCRRYSKKIQFMDNYFIDEPFEIHGDLLTCELFISDLIDPDPTVIFG